MSKDKRPQATTNAEPMTYERRRMAPAQHEQTPAREEAAAKGAGKATTTTKSEGSHASTV